MTNRIQTLTRATLAMLAVAVGSAVAVRKNMPDDDDVEEILQELSGTHWQEDMDINEVGSVEVEKPATGEEDYFHIFSGVAEERYRIIVFDNEPQYLGYYPSNYEPVDYEEGAVLLDAEDGESYFTIPIPAYGPADKIRIDLTPTSFVKNEKADFEKTSGVAGQPGSTGQKDTSEPQYEYRDWTLESDGKDYLFNAIFVRREDDRIYLKESKRGLVNDFPAIAFSEEDKKYLLEKGIFK